MTVAALGLLLVAVVLEVLGQTCFKLGARWASRIRSDRVSDVFHSRYLNRWVALGLSAYVMELALWLAVLSTAQLSQAFPLLALSYCGVALAGRLIFKERFRSSMVVGIGLITVGAAMILWAA